MMADAFKGTGQLTKLLVRQHRIKILLWIAGLVGIPLAVALVYPTVLQSQEEVLGLGATMQNPAMIALAGPAYELEDYTIATALAAELLLFTAIAAAIMNALLISSSTRLDEEEGRLEMIRALPTGRLAYLTAAFWMVLAVNGLIFVLLGSGFFLLGHESMDAEGSFLFAAVLSATGIFFAGLTAVTAQLAETARGATGLSFGLLALFYAVRAVGDVGNETLALFSPLGWTVRTAVFAENQWWPIGALSLGAAVLAGAALFLNQKRDMFSGVLPVRRGRTHASSFLTTLPGLVWRLEKNTLLGWGAGLFLMSLASGAVLGDLELYFAELDLLESILSGGIDSTRMVEQFVALIIAILSVFAAAVPVTLILSLLKEERLNRTEHFYSRSVSRNKVMGSYTAWAFFATILMQTAIGLGLYLSASQVMEEKLELTAFMEGAWVYLPSVWVILGAAVFLAGWFPKAAKAVWLYIVFAFLVMYVGNLLEFPEWMKSLSSFHHVPALPYAAMDWTPLFVLSGLAAGLTLLGFLGYNKRDIQG